MPPSATAASPPQSSREDQLKLQLHMESQELEIKRLQLELQLAQLKLASNTVKTPKQDESVKSGDRSSERSLGDQRAPQRITNPQEWPHIFAPCEPQLFNELSMAEFSAGYTVILQRCTDVSRRQSLISIFTISWFLRLEKYRNGPCVLGGFLRFTQAAFFLVNCSPHGFNQQTTRPPSPQTAFKLPFWPLYFPQ